MDDKKEGINMSLGEFSSNIFFCHFSECKKACLRTKWNISDDYIQDSGFYFSPYGDIGLTNSTMLKDVKNHSMKDELDNIIKELDEAARDANNEEKKYKNTLDEMIMKGNVKGLPKGIKPNVGLEDQGIKLPLNKNNLRPNPMQRPMNGHKNGPKNNHNLISKLKGVLQSGKMRNANDFQRLPNAMNVPTNGKLQAPPLIPLNLLNDMKFDTSAVRNFVQKNNNIGLEEYIHTVNNNFKSKFDMTVQQEIAEKQKKFVVLTEDGSAPVSSDGPGIDHKCYILGTNITLHQRFSAY